MAVFVEAGRGWREWESRKSISGAVRGSPVRRYRPARGEKVKVETLFLLWSNNLPPSERTTSRTAL